MCDENNLLICPKVRLEDIVEVDTKENAYKFRNYIKSKHIDFVLCDNKLNALAALELDDNTHYTSKKTQNSDEFKENVFKAVNLPLFRVKMNQGYYEKEIQAIIDKIKV